MTKKNFKKGFLNWLEELVSSRLEELHRSKWVKSKIEYKMLFALLKLPLKKESLLVEVALCFMQVEFLIL